MKAFLKALLFFNIVPLYSMQFNKPCETIKDERDLRLARTTSRSEYPIQHVRDVSSRAGFRLGPPDPTILTYTREGSTKMEDGESIQTIYEVYKFRTSDGTVKDIYQGRLTTKITAPPKPKESFFNAHFITAVLCVAAGIGGYHLAAKLETKKLSN